MNDANPTLPSFRLTYTSGFRLIVLIILISLIPKGIIAADFDTLFIKNSSTSFKVNPYSRVFHTSLKLSGSEAWDLIRSEKISKSNYNTNPGINFPDEAFWMILNIRNQTENSIDFYLELEYPQMDEINLFQIEGETAFRRYETGDNLDFDQRPVIYRNFLFPITIRKDECITLLFNFDKRQSIVRFPLFYHSKEHFDKKMAQEQWFHGIYFGFIAFISLVALILGIVVPSNLFLRYSLYVMAFCLWLFTRLGYTYQYLISSNPELNLHFVPLTTAIATVALIFYIQSFFETKKYLKRFHQVMNGVLIYFALGFTYWLISPEKIIEMGSLMLNIRYVITFLVIAFTFVSTFRFYKIDKFRSLVFFAAYTILFLAIFSKLFAEYSIIDESTLIFDPMMVGFLIEILVLSIAMALILKKKLKTHDDLKTQTDYLQDSLSNAEKVLDHSTTGFITLRSKAVLSLEEIRYIKSDDHYLEFYLENRERPEIDRDTLSALRKSLPLYFQQIHRSIIINQHHLRAIFSEKVILKDGTELRLSRKFKEEIQKKVKDSPQLED